MGVTCARLSGTLDRMDASVSTPQYEPPNLVDGLLPLIRRVRWLMFLLADDLQGNLDRDSLCSPLP